ncbi:MAG: CoA-binding protein, partial [Methanobrevibacter sp.]
MDSLDKMFKPDSVAIIGASNSEGKVGYIIVNNLLKGNYGGKIYPINPKDDEIQGLKSYKSVLELPETPDLAVISIPSKGVNPVLEECGKKFIKNVVVISAGFKEIGGEGVKLEEELKSIAEKYDMNLIGPNSLGISDSHTPLNASFSQSMPPRGN